MVGRSGGESFKEDLVLRPLADGNVMTHFVFRTTCAVPDSLLLPRGRGGQRKARLDPLHLNMFPKVIAEIVRTYGVGEVHLSFSRGRWQTERWSHPPVAAPQGVELRAWFLPTEGLKEAWKGITHALSGLFGASINFLEPATKHIHPKK